MELTQRNYPVKHVDQSQRVLSLDQFRGYTVLGMCVVNFLGSFAVTPAVLQHHNTYCSYADTIMPQFFFAVGFAYRLTFLSRLANEARVAVYRRFWQRNLRLILFGGLLYLAAAAADAWTRPEPPSAWQFLAVVTREHLFQTLVHIGLTALWIMPVIGARPGVRILFALGSAGLHLGLSHWFYYKWVHAADGIDGGPLGFLTWTIPMIAGSLAFDLMARSAKPQDAVRPLLLCGCAAMAFAYVFSCLNAVAPPNTPASGNAGFWLVEPPFVPPTHPVNLWTMSQRAGSVTYLLFGAGFSMGVVAMFVWACDVHRLQLGMWRTFGTNALAAYLIQAVIGGVVGQVIPKDAPLEIVLAGLFLFVGTCYVCVRMLEWKGIYWRM
jgi:predicted acyltransferase